jgi:hypothetical protein
LAAVVLLVSCGGKSGSSSTGSTSPPSSATEATTTTVAATTTTAPAGVKAADIAAAIDAAGLGCKDATPVNPKPAAGYPTIVDAVTCTASGHKITISAYASESDPPAYVVAASKSVCAATKGGSVNAAVVEGRRFVIGTDNSDPALAAKLATATKAKVSKFSC